MNKHKVKIIATSAGEFSAIETALSQLPYDILEDIETAEYGIIGLTCTMTNRFVTERRFHFPKGVTQIQEFDEYIGVYCGDFFFKIVKNDFLKKIIYLFVDTDPKK